MIIGPVTTGGKSFMMRFAPKTKNKRAKTTYVKPAATIPPVAYGMPSVPAAPKIAPMNANEEPRKIGTFLFVMKKNQIVAIPAQNKVTEIDIPQIIGTRTVAPNIANTCCRPRTIILPFQAL